MDYLADPRYQFGLIAAGLVFAAIIVLRLLGRRGGKAQRPVDPQVQRFLNSGNYEGAARYEQQRGNYEEALDLFLQAQRPRNAADMAVRLDQPRRAAELYERAKEYAQAARYYGEAGLKGRAREMERKAPEVREEAKEATPGARAEGERFDSMVTPTRRAEDLEREFQQVKAAADAGDPKAQERLVEIGRETAEVLLSAGHMERAAEVCRDAGLIDQAVNLYVNLLGKPGEAAVLLARKGEHQRAAELFEAAGENQRALACWVDHSLGTDDPLAHLPEVEQRFGPQAAVTMLDTLVKKRPPTGENLDLHYRIAEEYTRRKETGPAITVLQNLDNVHPRYMDVRERISKLRTGTPQVPKAPWEYEQEGREPPAPRSPADEAFDLMGGGGGRELDMGGGMTDADSDALLSQLEPNAWAPESLSGLGDLRSDDSALDDAGADPGELELLDPDDDDGEVDGGFPQRELTPLHKASSAARRMGIDSDPMAQPDPLTGPSVEEIVNRAARKAAEEAVNRARSQIIAIEAAGPSVLAGGGNTRPMRLGFEEQVVTLRFSRDHAVREAVSGSELELLAEKLKDEQPVADNADHFFRLGLGMVNAGRWLEAREIFNAINAVRPGYLDAGDRAQELGKWEEAVHRTVAQQGPGGGQLLERYKLLGEIGRGGMAVVYRARDLALDREVALKFLAETMIEDPRMADLFRREAKAAAKLNHPNIVTIYDFGTLGDRAFICMELMDGETVEEIMIRDDRLATLDALAIAEDILQALEYAHSQEIIHRDIKPSNVMRNERGECKLMDFGLAKSISDGGKTTMVAGTPIYMAPEQFTGKDVDARSDLFALGASLYEMITGAPPFESVARDTPPTSMRVSCPKVPAMLDRLVLKALEFDKSKRVQSAAEMLEPVRYILNTVRSYLRNTAGGPRPTPTAVPAQSRKTAPSGDGKVTRALGSKGGID